jgi:Xaa-Pro aminopeptidase
MTTNSAISTRIKELRTAMEKHGIDAFIIPSSDPHQSEYVCDHWKSREYFSGFTGSSAYLVLFHDYAALFTDSRYFLQAETELAGSEVILHKQKVPHAPEHVKWMSERLGPNSKIGVEGLLFSKDQVAYLKSVFDKKQQELVNVDGIVDEAWANRAKMPDSLAYEHELSFAGKSREQKLASLREEMRANNAEYYFVSALDEIAWLLNLRAWDIEYTPVALAYLIVGTKESVLYINKDRVASSLLKALNDAHVLVQDYSLAEDDLRSIAENRSIYIDADTISWTFDEGIKANKIVGHSLINPLQAIKSDEELKHIQNAMIKDGVALSKFFIWLEQNIGKKRYRESDLASKIAEFRSEQMNYVGESFSAIVGFRSNGAIVHYHPDEEKSAVIEGDGMLLIDSGGQYLDGTTDITRTIYLGDPSEEHCRNFTLVLKGNIALQTIKFPEGTTGMQLDTLARMFLWRDGLNYGHGTGHGVGYFLRVHEPPQGFASSATTTRGRDAHLPGMFSSNEPGFYKAGEYGIRIENLMVCRESLSNAYAKFNEFEVMTLFPISTRLIDRSLLDENELEWLNAYHALVFEKLSPHLNEDERWWLEQACQKMEAL